MPGIDRRLIQNFEWPLFVFTALICAAGVVNLVSAAPGEADGMPSMALQQGARVGIGLLLMLAVLLPDYRTLERAAVALYVAVLALLALALWTGPVIHGSQRWIVAGPLRLQPSELAKLALILLFARLLNRRSSAPELGLSRLALPAVLIAIPAVLVLEQPDLGTTMLLALTPLSYVFVARVKLSSLVVLGVTGVVGAGGAWLFLLHDYQKERILTFLDPKRDPLGSAYHAIQSQIAVGSGGLFGQGFGQGPQSQLDFLPEQQTDFVFSVLAEEWGFVGAGLVLLLYLGILVRGLVIARASKDLFGAYLAVGIVALLFWEGAINVAMVVGLLPVVGVPLPFLSYGGSALLVCLVCVGLLMNVSMRRYVF